MAGLAAGTHFILNTSETSQRGIKGPTLARADPPPNFPYTPRSSHPPKTLLTPPPHASEHPSTLIFTNDTRPQIPPNTPKILLPYTPNSLRIPSPHAHRLRLLRSPRNGRNPRRTRPCRKKRERREAGSADRTVVLCVEIENSGELGIGVGVVVEKVDVKIGGEMRRRRLLAGEMVGLVRMRQRKRSLRGLDLWHRICSMRFRSCDLQKRWTRFHSQEQLVWVGLLNLTSNTQSPSTSLEILTSHLAHPRGHLPYYTLPTPSLHDGTAFSTSQHTKPSLGCHGRLRSRRRAPQHPS